MALPQALASWDILLRHGMRPGRLLQLHLREHVTGFPVPAGKNHPVSILRDLRTVLYAGFRIECRLASIGKPSRKPFPFGPASAFRAIANVGRASLTTPHHTFICIDHSRLLNGVTAFGSRFTAFSSSLPTFDDQSPAVGRCLHPGTWGGRS